MAEQVLALDDVELLVNPVARLRVAQLMEMGADGDVGTCFVRYVSIGLDALVPRPLGQRTLGDGAREQSRRSEPDGSAPSALRMYMRSILAVFGTR